MNDISQNIESVYKADLPKLKSYLYRLTCEKEIVNDIANDTFLKALEKKHTFNGSSSLKTWIFSIATRTAIDYLRKKKRWPENAQDEARKLAESDNKYSNEFIRINNESTAGAFEVKEHINFCFTCISKTLPIEQQISLILKDIYGFKVDEISSILGCPKGTSKHRLFEARKKMNHIFERRCALVNKNGVCYQCSELDDYFNPKKKKEQINLQSENSGDKEDYYTLRAQLVKAIDPLESKGNKLEESIMQVLRRAIDDK
ncbi:MAG: sigma-70 family RNA polymerase sigma factor [Salibacteraceae bacterium]